MFGQEMLKVTGENLFLPSVMIEQHYPPVLINADRVAKAVFRDNVPGVGPRPFFIAKPLRNVHYRPSLSHYLDWP